MRPYVRTIFRDKQTNRRDTNIQHGYEDRLSRFINSITSYRGSLPTSFAKTIIPLSFTV